MSAHVAAVLRRARQRIASPERWCQYTDARDTHGDPVDDSDPTACQWCALGDMFAEVGGDPDCPLAMDAADALDAACGETNIVQVNDRQGHQAVLDAYDRAIAAEEAS